MIILGYIISDRKLTNLKGFVECVKDITLADSSKPILVVGYKKAKKVFGDKFNILEKKISDKIFWTFSKTERRVDYDDDIENFYSFCINNIINNINYYYINILKLKYNKIKNLYNILFSENKKYIYINNGMVYLSFKDSDILGISLRILKYCQINPSKILDKIKSNKSNIIVDSNDDFVKMFKKEVVNKDYVIPLFLKLNDN